MNNALVVIDDFEEVPDVSPRLRERQSELIKIIDALEAVGGSDQWKLLKDMVFDGLVKSIESSISIEAAKKEINTAELYRLDGKLSLARKYADIYKLVEAYKVELTNLTKKLNENE